MRNRSPCVFKSRFICICLIGSVPLSLLCYRPVQAQQSPEAASAPQNGELAEVIVNARKREESILNVPVIETAIPQAQLEKMQTVEIGDLPNIVPGLDFGRTVLSIGTQASIRGIGSVALDQGVDPSVALNIDGMAPGTGLALESGLFDLGQVEVLKGPQALFFGKGTPGGVISLRTADPTDQFEVIARTAYEFVSVTPREEAIISGPITDTLKARLAGMYSTSEGYFQNQGVAVPGTGAVTPTDPRAPRSQDYIIRGTVLWDPSSQFDARLKLNLVHDYIVDAESAQYTDCPEGADFAPAAGIHFIGTEPGNCHGLSKNLYTVWLDPSAYRAGLIINHGIPSTDTQQEFATLELNYRPTQALTVTSVTADYLIRSDDLTNAFETSGAGSPLGAVNHFHRRELTQEVRLNSDFAAPVNFTLGGFYEDGLMTVNAILPFNTALALPPNALDDVNPVAITTYSAFGQTRWEILPRLELAAGLRWSDETRTESPVSANGATIPVLQPRVHANNDSPEVTLTYRPTDDLTAFAAWKEGFKSGSFSLSTPVNPGTSNAFGEETVRGGEMGLKSRLLDRHLTANLAAYLYNYSGLQVGANVPASSGGITLQTVNAGAARVYGLEFDTAYRPAEVEGLGVSAALNWNHARYLTLDNLPCWGGQTIAAGCNQIFNAGTGHYTSQNLAGTPLLRAPNWDAHLGFDYDYPLARGYKLTLSNNNAFSSRYVTFLAIGRPNDDNYQGSFVKADVSLTLTAPNDSWEIALIGKDLNDRLTSGTCAAGNQAAGGLLASQITGGTTSGRDGLDEAACFADPGREVWLRLTLRPFK